MAAGLSGESDSRLASFVDADVVRELDALVPGNGEWSRRQLRGDSSHLTSLTQRVTADEPLNIAETREAAGLPYNTADDPIYSTVPRLLGRRLLNWAQRGKQ